MTIRYIGHSIKLNKENTKIVLEVLTSKPSNKLLNVEPVPIVGIDDYSLINSIYDIDE